MSNAIRRARGKRKSNNDLAGYLIISIALVIIVLFIVTYVRVSGSQVVLMDNLCREDGVVPRETVLLIDATDSYSESQRDQVLFKINEYIDDSLEYERLTLYALNEDPDTFLPTFSICNPGDGGDASEWTENKKQLARTWETRFKNELTEAINPLVGQNSAENSPIIEMLKFVGIRTFLESKSSERRIILVSDMMEHTERYSHYDDPINFKQIENTPFEISIRPNLPNVEVDVLYLYRPELAGYQNLGHIEEFWSPLISVSGGKLTNASRIN